MKLRSSDIIDGSCRSFSSYELLLPLEKNLGNVIVYAQVHILQNYFLRENYVVIDSSEQDLHIFATSLMYRIIMH